MNFLVVKLSYDCEWTGPCAYTHVCVNTCHIVLMEVRTPKVAALPSTCLWVLCSHCGIRQANWPAKCCRFSHICSPSSQGRIRITDMYYHIWCSQEFRFRSSLLFCTCFIHWIINRPSPDFISFFSYRVWYAAQDDFKISIILSQPPTCWGSKVCAALSGLHSDTFLTQDKLDYYKIHDISSIGLETDG